jgi:hypothetical protein
MKAGVKVSSRKEKELIEKGLAHPRVLDLVRTIGEIQSMPNPNLRDHAMKFFDGVLCSSAVTPAGVGVEPTTWPKEAK